MYLSSNVCCASWLFHWTEMCSSLPHTMLGPECIILPSLKNKGTLWESCYFIPHSTFKNLYLLYKVCPAYLMVIHAWLEFFVVVLFLFLFFPFIFISWRLITLQYGSGFCHTLTWISHGFTYIPHPDPPSHLPLHSIPLGLPSALGPSTCLMHPAWAGDLFHPR